MKKFVILAAISVLCCITLFGCTPPTVDTPPDNQPTPTPSPQPSSVLGVWWWSKALGDEYWDFAVQQGVNQVYYCAGTELDDNTEAFLQKAHNRNIKVLLLMGNSSWIEKNEKLFARVDKYLEFQQSHTYKFGGIHFDVEPQQHEDFDTRRNELIELFAQLTYTVKQRYPDIWIEYDIPFWLENEVTAGGVTKPAFQHVLDNASGVTVMSYRETAQKAYSSSEAELAYAKQIGKPINLSLDTKSFADNAAMMEQLHLLREMLPQEVGLCVHQIEKWRQMPAGVSN